MIEFSQEDLDNRFGYHKADTNEKVNKHAAIRSCCAGLAYDLYAIIPGCRELSQAMTNLEQVMFWANAAAARMDNDGNRL